MLLSPFISPMAGTRFCLSASIFAKVGSFLQAFLPPSFQQGKCFPKFWAGIICSHSMRLILWLIFPFLVYSFLGAYKSLLITSKLIYFPFLLTLKGA
uniref:Uncharacterized protein n=1 Tax=Campylobacter jejuni TaxID=197 RepID=E5F1R5_CAMJU|nr:hypothetical protein [Campylobacter jejuni]ADX98439.1 hypothetical protein [Campylobacter jejuni]